MDIDHLNRMPFAELTGFAWTRAENGEAAIVMDVRQAHSNSSGKLHGGMLAALADSVGTTAIATAVGRSVVTADLRVSYLRPVEPGQRITASATMTHIAGSTGFASITLADDSGEVLCLGQITCIIRKPSS